MRKKIVLPILLFALFLPTLALAKIGVGVATGKIQVDQPLKAGLLFTLPPVTILNTGDEASWYGVGIQYHENYKELRPAKEWFSFEPQEFYLEPGGSQAVQVKLSLPVKGVDPGDYFCFLQGFPVKKAVTEGTSVGIAAAAKLYFTIEPANFFAGAYYRLNSLFHLYQPWSYIILGVVILSILIIFVRRFISFNIKIGRKEK